MQYFADNFCFMPLSFSVESKNPVRARVARDPLIQMQEKYKVYYQTFDRQEGTRVWKDGKELVMLSSNDYLGLGEDSRVIEAGQKALEQWGSSTTGARLANGSRRYHEELEADLAEFLGVEACHVSVAGYLSCMSAIASFANRGDLICVDKNVHSALMSGIRLTDARVERFRHNDPEDLREILSYEKPKTVKLLVFEGVYSMEGHIAPVDSILEVSAEHNCFSVMDDAHGFGVLGEGGRGTLNRFGKDGAVDLVCGSFSKALSSTGGFVAGDRELINYLRTHSKQTIFSAALSPSQAACASAALGLLRREPEHIETLWSNTGRYLKMLQDRNLDTWESRTPAIPIVLGSKEKAYFFWRALMEKGVFTVMSVAPGVPPGKDLIRTSISARHTEEDFDRIETALDYAISRI